MDEKDHELLKKVAASDGEMPSDLEDLGEEEVAQAVEGLKMGQGERGSSPSIVHDPKMEAEIKEMFRDIVSQYITPVGKSIRALANGDASERNIDICIGALKPLTMAAEEIHYNDIYDVLKSIEQPLVSFREGKKRLLSKKDIRNITTDYKELMRLISRSVGSEMVDPASTGAVRATTAAPIAAGDLDANAELHISDALSFFKDADHGDIQRLYAAGLIKLGLLSQATAQEISESTGIAIDDAERLKLAALNALANLPAQQVAAEPPPKADTHEAREAREAHYDAPAARTVRFDLEEEDESPAYTEGKERWVSAIDTMMAEVAHYFQSATVLTTELERSHRAIMRLRVARERLKGELEFCQDDLAEMLDSGERLNDEHGTPVNAHRQLLKHLQRAIEQVNTAMKKTELVYGQLDDSMEDLQDIEAQLIALRRRKNSSLKRNSLHRRTAEPLDEAETTGDEPLPRRLN